MLLKEAVHKLNSLQSNKATIAQIRKDIKTGQKCTNLEDMENYLMRTGISLNTLDKLSVIHVAGTKGKGSTSAMCESILRAHGFRTGFYSSPHLVAVRERIRLFGLPLSEEAFARHFHKVYDSLYKTQAYDGDMPKYFAFLTVMAFNVFLEEEVDVAVVEVGIGGIIDYTNIIRKVPVIGITALGLDHTSILGNTLPEIALAKAGIMKPGCVAYTVHQDTEAMDVLRRKAVEFQCPLTIVPNYSTYSFQNGLRLSIELEAYRMNASLSIQLAHAWMRMKNKVKYNIDNINQNTDLLISSLSKETVIGLRDCKWPGRYQVIETEYGCVYLDGAHTKESMEICAKWFAENCRFHHKDLIFSATGDRNAEVLLKPLSHMHFDTVYFVIPIAHKEISNKSDNYTIMEHNELISRCNIYANIWKNINKQSRKIVVLECVSDVLRCINNKEKRSILITGSLHLVGAALSVIDPNLTK
ncbi:folylpolyglutamate synthase, mitochondrial-like isoform X2 [Pieris rapae]|uniref:folylpolyglutamate synthase, mitochondrial-like isoform X2 n=1 Tax=Pieris rapae TaxID=64459 RepID=UPI001E27A49F|nr:folylpolyglutamate synthase, mitochondrial-like isoform X2 [Pieris rapae]